MITRRRVQLAVLALFLVGVGVTAWDLAGLPPVKYFLRYGLDPYCEPTGQEVTLEGVEFVEIGPGIFRMGSDYLAEQGDWLGKLCRPLGLPWGRQPYAAIAKRELPVHWVEFRHGFWIATTEITNAQYERFAKDHKRHDSSSGNDTPVVEVSWGDAKRYCAWLSEKSGRLIRLPSEAEWECACRAGSDGEFTFGDDWATLSEFAWYDENSEGHAHAVGTKRPNRWGLHDLHGNVFEMCEDTWHDSYDEAPRDGLPWVDEGSRLRVVRGGVFFDDDKYCRSAFRERGEPVNRYWHVGFRPAFVVPED